MNTAVYVNTSKNESKAGQKRLFIRYFGYKNSVQKGSAIFSESITCIHLLCEMESFFVETT